MSHGGMEDSRRDSQCGIAVVFGRRCIQDASRWPEADITIAVFLGEVERLSWFGACQDEHESVAVPRHRSRKKHRGTEANHVEANSRKHQPGQFARHATSAQLAGLETGSSNARDEKVRISDHQLRQHRLRWTHGAQVAVGWRHCKLRFLDSDLVGRFDCS